MLVWSPTIATVNSSGFSNVMWRGPLRVSSMTWTSGPAVVSPSADRIGRSPGPERPKLYKPGLADARSTPVAPSARCGSWVGYHRPMTDLLRRAYSGPRDWLLAERPDWKVAALAVVAAVAAAAVCLPRDYQRSGLHVPLAAALGVMAVGIAVAVLAAYRPWPALLGLDIWPCRSSPLRAWGRSWVGSN